MTEEEIQKIVVDVLVDDFECERETITSFSFDSISSRVMSA